ncbi:MAG: hypothetical protein ACKO1J_20480 [Tagaea sp.]
MTSVDLAKDAQLVSMVALTRLHQLDSHLHALFAGTVQSGPFSGLRLVRPTHSYLGLSCRLLGTMESQLHAPIEDALSRPLAGLINVGASDGFYSLGMLKRRPDLRAIVFEADPAYAETIRANAELNGLSARIENRGYGDRQAIGQAIADLGGGRVHFIVDCEGAEKEILDPDGCPGLRGVEIIVECHDFVDRSITRVLRERFSNSHDIVEIGETMRPVSPHPAIAKMSEIDRLLAMCESRPEAMTWLWMRPR